MRLIKKCIFRINNGLKELYFCIFIKLESNNNIFIYQCEFKWRKSWYCDFNKGTIILCDKNCWRLTKWWLTVWAEVVSPWQCCKFFLLIRADTRLTSIWEFYWQKPDFNLDRWVSLFLSLLELGQWSLDLGGNIEWTIN